MQFLSFRVSARERQDGSAIVWILLIRQAVHRHIRFRRQGIIRKHLAPCVIHAVPGLRLLLLRFTLSRQKNRADLCIEMNPVASCGFLRTRSLIAGLLPKVRKVRRIPLFNPRQQHRQRSVIPVYTCKPARAGIPEQRRLLQRRLLFTRQKFFRMPAATGIIAICHTLQIVAQNPLGISTRRLTVRNRIGRTDDIGNRAVKRICVLNAADCAVPSAASAVDVPIWTMLVSINFTCFFPGKFRSRSTRLRRHVRIRRISEAGRRPQIGLDKIRAMRQTEADFIVYAGRTVGDHLLIRPGKWRQILIEASLIRFL